MAFWGFCQILFGCCLNVLSLEALVAYDPNAGALVTLCQVLCVVCMGSLEWIGSISMSSVDLPLVSYLLQSFLAFLVSVMNNGALAFRVSMPLHMVFRSSSLVTTLVMGWTMLGQQYDEGQWAGCVLVSVGIVIATGADAMTRGNIRLSCCGWIMEGLGLWESAKQEVHEAAEMGASIFSNALKLKNVFVVDWVWLTGIGILALALILSALLGFLQEFIQKGMKRSWQESLLFTHLFSLPFFVFYYYQIQERFTSWIASPYYQIQILDDVYVISIFTAMLVNALSQFVCFCCLFVHVGTFVSAVCTFL